MKLFNNLRINTKSARERKQVNQRRRKIFKKSYFYAVKANFGTIEKFVSLEKSIFAENEPVSMEGFLCSTCDTAINLLLDLILLKFNCVPCGDRSNKKHVQFSSN